MLPKVFAVYHPSTETFQILQTETLEDGSIVRLKNWSRPSRGNYDTTADELLRFSKGNEWCVCKTNKDLSESELPIYKETLHGKDYNFWFLNHMLVWTNYNIYVDRHGRTKEDWMKSPMIPVVEFYTKQVYPRTNTGFYVHWSETTKDAIEAISAAGRQKCIEHGLTEAYDHIDPRYLRIRTPSPRDEDLMSSDDCCESDAGKRGRGFSDMADSVDEHIEGLCAGKTFTQQFSMCILLLFVGLWVGSVATTTLHHYS